MSKFVIQPHFRLQEWVADEKGYFAAEGLDYVFNEEVQATDGKVHDKGQKVGAYQSFETGRASDVSCACHWTVNVAASSGLGKLYSEAYSVAPAGIFVPANSAVRHPADLAGVPISVGYQSGSHYSSIQSLEQYLPPDDIHLSFNDGMLFKRMQLLIDGGIPAAERIVFEPYTEEAFNRSREWIAQHGIFGPGGLGTGTYEQVIAFPVQPAAQ